jgi:hypothetical protein
MGMLLCLTPVNRGTSAPVRRSAVFRRQKREDPPRFGNIAARAGSSVDPKPAHRFTAFMARSGYLAPAATPGGAIRLISSRSSAVISSAMAAAFSIR